MRPFCSPLLRMTMKLSSENSSGSRRRVSACSAFSDWMLPLTTAAIGSKMKTITAMFARCRKKRIEGEVLNIRASLSQRHSAIDQAHVGEGDQPDHHRQDEGRGGAHAKVVG